MNKIEIRAKAIELAIASLQKPTDNQSMSHVLLKADAYERELLMLYKEPKLQQAETSIPFIPLMDRIVVEEAPEVVKTKGGIIIPDTVEKEAKTEGIIVAMGNGFTGQPMVVKVGDIVVYSKYAGSDITIDGKKYKSIKEIDVFGILLPTENESDEAEAKAI